MRRENLYGNGFFFLYDICFFLKDALDYKVTYYLWSPCLLIFTYFVTACDNFFEENSAPINIDFDRKISPSTTRDGDDS